MTESKKSFQLWLDNHSACEPAVEWVGHKPFAEAWDTCERPDWMLWVYLEHVKSLGVLGKASTHRRYVRLAIEFARRALRHVPAGEDRPRLAVEAAEAWLNGTGTREEARAAAADAAYAAAAAYAYAAASAASAAYAAYAAADAADAAYAAYAAADADAAAAAAYASDASERRAQCDLIRKLIPRRGAPK